MLIKFSRKIGERSDLTQGGGGNCSVKFQYNDCLFMVIKSSGYCLADLNLFSGYSLVCRQNEEDILIWGNKVSIETPMHWNCEKKIVIHCHPEYILKESLYGDFMVPYVEPGLELAKAIQPFVKEEIITLTNHGIILQLDNDNIEGINKINQICKCNEKDIFCNTLSNEQYLVKQSNYSELFCSIQSEEKYKVFFPDFAVYYHHIIFSEKGVYIKGESLKQIRQIDEIFGAHVECCKQLKEGKTPKCINIESINCRQDEQYRINQSK